jgi:hypothetical protein
MREHPGTMPEKERWITTMEQVEGKSAKEIYSGTT